MMVVLGVDAHKRSHTVVAAGEGGEELGRIGVAADREGHLRALIWAARFAERRWAIEDCRDLSRRLEGDLVCAGELVVRVPPKMMAGVRRSARTRGKSDPIDALAVARAALSEPGLPVARLEGPAREVRLLVDYRETLVKARTAAQNSLRWRLHELEPGFDPKPGSLNSAKTLAEVEKVLANHGGVVADLARRETTRIGELTREANQLQAEIATRVASLAPSLLAIPGCGVLSAAKLVGETADPTRFKSADAFAMWAGVAPIPVWSGNAERFRLNRGGNRQVNAAVYRIAITQLRIHDPARAQAARHQAAGKTKREALRILKHRISHVAFRAMLEDSQTHQPVKSERVV